MTVVTLLVLIWGRKKLAQQPILAFFFVASILAFVLFVGWRLYWGSFLSIFEAFKF
jgi:type IV secretory pathway TrbL component